MDNIKLRRYSRINLIALIVVAFSIVITTMWILPKESNDNQAITQKYIQIAKNYDTTKVTCKNIQQVEKLQGDISKIQSTSIVNKIFKTCLISAVLVTLIGLLGGWLQYVFTDIKFTHQTNAVASMGLLATIIPSVTILVCLVFYLMFTA
jgi:hypothetical protein